MRSFEKISFNQFKKDIVDDIELYNNFNLPKRSTKESAGYDFESLIDYILKPNETIKIPLGIKVKLNPGEALLLIVRSSMGFKYNIRMCNQVGLIDQDYYDNPDNEGHMWIKIKNEGAFPFEIKKHDRICQGIIINYLTVDNEEKIEKERISGIGSTTEVKK
ncbi:MAG: deoxyuridine 5'-triphosphate nucleotidohydrolase [Erysipelotrichaceae bacterium]|nr:deoxyuridine 5'-triphosphate nucleotidohydrolase [Erysipelotrichaceae bacterium]